ncbi:MAG: DUF4254 domain-containing protein [Thermodesulfobacteriota bacterium]|nr:DUF4254 domain-containing protein [Thermodesulfobacteriota bacterium]
MSPSAFTELKKVLRGCLQGQMKSVSDWHVLEPESVPDGQGAADLEVLENLVLGLHLVNFKLWHVEDRARRMDAGHEAVAECKREIDALNQSRNDLMEKVDACLVALISPHVPLDAKDCYNTETLGAVLDRLSILSLKLYHMEEQTRRREAGEDHIQRCREKLEILAEQHRDLSRSLLELVDEYAGGRKRPKVYYQFKMYNDPDLNPELYRK